MLEELFDIPKKEIKGQTLAEGMTTTAFSKPLINNAKKINATNNIATVRIVGKILQSKQNDNTTKK
jgi:hypothetical protein